MMLSICTEYWQIFLAQGLVVGLGGGMLYIPAIALVTTQFTTKRPLAVGLASSGSSIGKLSTVATQKALNSSIFQAASSSR
jgi:MFS family permease